MKWWLLSTTSRDLVIETPSGQKIEFKENEEAMEIFHSMRERFANKEKE